ncbi:MAG: flagellar biosynthetic protein FliR [Blastopirellula sp. JB062]
MESLPLLQPTLHQLFIFVTVLTRISGMIATAPMLGSNYAPPKIKAFLAVTMAIMITGLFWGEKFPTPEHWMSYLVILGGELFIGISFGLGVRILFAGVQITGQLLGQIGGMSVADVFNPAFDDNVPMLSVLFDMVVVAMFFCVGGHRFMIAALLSTFADVPPGVGLASPEVAHVLVTTLSTSFMLGVQAAAPGVVALMIGVLVMGLISRTLPQLNLIAVGFSLNTMLLMTFVFLTVGTMGWLFQDQLEPTVNQIRELVIDRAVMFPP